MKPDFFVKKLRQEVVEGNLKLYRRMFINNSSNEAKDSYAKKSLALFHSLNEEQQDMFFDIIRQVLVDTTSNIFGILDGTSCCEGIDEGMRLIASNDKILNGSLQDLFLELEETD